MTYRWLSKETVKQICAIQQGGEHGIGAAMKECIGAYRLFGAIEAWFEGQVTQAQRIVEKINVEEWSSVETIQKCLAVRKRHDSDEAFTPTCLAAWQQLADAKKLLAGATPEQLERIKARHELYRVAQVTPGEWRV